MATGRKLFGGGYGDQSGGSDALWGVGTPEVCACGEGLAPVFAGGDCVNGGKEVVDAVQAGKEAAAAILAYFAKS